MIEDVVSELERLITAGEPYDVVVNRLTGLAQSAYEQRGQPMVTLRCGIEDQGSKRACLRRAGQIFPTPDGAVFSEDSRQTNTPKHAMFVYQTGFLTIRTANVDGEALTVAAAAPYARCGRHGPFLLATKPSSIGRNLLDVARVQRESVLVVPAIAGRPAHPVNGAAGELGSDLSALAKLVNKTNDVLISRKQVRSSR